MTLRTLRMLFGGAVLFACAVFAAPAAAQDGPPIPEPQGFVNDVAGVMPEQDVARLEAFLDQLMRKTGVQFAVLTMQSTAPATPTEYKVRVFEKWGIGQAGEDNGLLLLVAMDEREARFETGYGLEGTLPDGLQSRIFRNYMQPKFREGDFGGGITEGVLRCAYRVAAEKGVTLEWNGEELRYSNRASGRRPFAPFALLVFGFVVIMIVVISSMRGGMAGPGGGFGGGRGYHGGWGGGFGGGGRSGGGGASFGGFGGGMSGGGGGGGSW